MVPVPSMSNCDHGTSTYRLKQCCDLCNTWGKVSVPTQFGKLCEKNQETEKIGVFDPKYFKIDNLFCQVVNIILT